MCIPIESNTIARESHDESILHGAIFGTLGLLFTCVGILLGLRFCRRSTSDSPTSTTYVIGTPVPVGNTCATAPDQV